MNRHMLQDKVHRSNFSNIAYNQPRKAPMKLLPGPSTCHVDESLISKQSKVESMLAIMSKLAKGKLSLGSKIKQVGGAEKVFRRVFSVREGKQLIKASKCCLSTTAGPVSGLLFISIDQVAFCSNKPVVKVTSFTGESLSFHCKVVIPIRKIKRANQSESVKNSSQKYLQVVTTDEFDFWFMGFVNFKRTCKCLQHAVSHNA